MNNKLSKEAYGGVHGKDYKPLLTGESKGGGSTIFIFSVLLAILFGASTAYSGMKAGLTVAAGIPGSILGSAIVAALARDKGIRGKNLLQGSSSGGESVASGIIFVLPAVLLIGQGLSFIEGLFVGIGGVLFGIGMSTLVYDYLIVEQHGKLPYPEAMAIAETLVASEGNTEAVKFMGMGFGIGGFLTLFTSSFFNTANNTISFVKETGYKVKFQTEANPMLLGLGYIVGTEASLMMFGGSILANFALLPLVGYLAGYAADTAMVWNMPDVAVNQMTVGMIQNSYLKYIGAGMMLSGGLIGAIKLIPVIFKSIKNTLSKSSSGASAGGGIDKLIIASGTILLMVFSVLNSSGNISMAIVACILCAVFSLMFVIVSGNLTGTIGTSNLPVSGMTIATLIIITIVFSINGWTSPEENKALLMFGTFVVTAIAIAGGYSQSQKATFVLGADKDEMTKYFTAASIAGVIAVIGVITLLSSKLVVTGDEAEFAIPQANLMATLTSGIMSGNLPLDMVLVGVVMGIVIYMFKLPVMTIAVGFYLSIATTSIILIGGIIRYFTEKFTKSDSIREARVSNGTSLSAGLIAGNSIIGLLGIVLQVSGIITPAEPQGFLAGNAIAFIILGALTLSVAVIIKSIGEPKSAN